MSLSATAMVATTLSTASPSSPQLWLPRSAPYTLAAEASDGRQDSELADLERKMNIAHGFYSAGTVGLVGGGVATVAGLGMALIGIIPAITGDDSLMTAGLGTAMVGAGVVVVSVPVFLTASWTGAAMLRHHGIHVSRVPGWVMLGGTATLLAGLSTDTRGIVLAGAAGGIGGALTQVVFTRRAFKLYEKKNAESTARAMLLPQWSPDGGAGLSLVIQY